MKRHLLCIPFCLSASLIAQHTWRKEEATPGVDVRTFVGNGEIAYRFREGVGVMNREKRSRLHEFYWKRKLVLSINEHDEQEEFYFGSSVTFHPDMKVEVNTWDYNKDGVVDVVRVGKVGAEEMLFYGRYKDGVFGPAPTDISFSALWELLESVKANNAQHHKSDRVDESEVE